MKIKHIKKTTSQSGSIKRFVQAKTFFSIVGIIMIYCVTACKSKAEYPKIDKTLAQYLPKSLEEEQAHTKIPINREIVVSDFFRFLDEVITQNDTMLSYKLTENLLLRANPYILEALVSTDYHIQLSRGNFIYNQRKMVILKPGDTLQIPGPKNAAVLLGKMANTHLVINIPAFELRILEYDSVLYKVNIRVGKNQKKYLEMAGGEVDLRTKTGTGEIVRVNRNPAFYDPVTGKRFKFTKRDDHRTTYMPQIPWLEPSINGQRYGQMIHPTSNPKTLGKAASNGCIGTSEADAWKIYYFAPVGTKVLIRYDLHMIDEKGDTIRYDDIYEYHRLSKTTVPFTLASFLPKRNEELCVCDFMF